MFLRSTLRKKDGKIHRYFSVVESVRPAATRHPHHRTLLYLGELNDSQQAVWTSAIDVFNTEKGQSESMALFPSDRTPPPALTVPTVSLNLAGYTLKNPRQFGACWMGCQLWRELDLDQFWDQKLGTSREGTDWSKMLQVSTVYRLVEPGSEWRCHRLWFDQSAMQDLLGPDLVWGGKDLLYELLDQLLEHRDALFDHLKSRWQDLFGAKYEVLLYDLTSTYFEGEAEAIPKAKRGYSRDHRPDCKQVVIALILTTEGFPLGYEVLDGTTQDKTTLPAMIELIEKRYGKAERIWIMDRGVPTEAVLEELRRLKPEVKYLVGTPRPQVKNTRSQWETLPWTKVRGSVEVKTFEEKGETYVVAKSGGRAEKELAIRRKKLARLLRTLRGMRKVRSRDQLLTRLGAAKCKAGRAFGYVEIRLPKKDEAVNGETFGFELKKEKLAEAELNDGHYILRTNLTKSDPEWLWRLYMMLAQIEAAFRNFKNDLKLRPIYHQLGRRVDGHIFVCFLSYCLHVLLQKKLAVLAPGLTVRQALDRLASVRMLDVEIPTTDGRKLTMSRHTKPEEAVELLLGQLKMKLPDQPPPRLVSQDTLEI